MADLPKNVEIRLRKHLSSLEMRLDLEKQLLEQVTPEYPVGHKITDEEAATYRQLREPIVHTIVAYGNAIRGIYESFPELKKKG